MNYSYVALIIDTSNVLSRCELSLEDTSVIFLNCMTGKVSSDETLLISNKLVDIGL